MNTTTLINYLESHGIDSTYSNEMAQKIEHSDKKIYNAIVDYIGKGQEPNVNVEGYTCKSLQEKYPKMTTIAALLTLDWLLREPEIAKKAIEEGVK